MGNPGLALGGIALVTLSPCLTLLMVFLGRRYSRTSNAMKRWPIARGTVLASEIARHTDDGSASFSPRITYSYEVFGRTYQCENFDVFDLLGGRSSGSADVARREASRYPVGCQVEVRYDPENPQRALLDVTTPVGMIWFLYGMAAFSVLMGVGGMVMTVVSQFVD
jgi:hypothetical protein